MAHEFRYLTQADMPWLTKLVGDPETVEQRLPELERYAQIGSIPLKDFEDPSDRDDAFAAREQFLLLAGINESTLTIVEENAEQRAYVGLTSTFIQAQRLLEARGVDAKQVYVNSPTLVNTSAEKWSDVLTDAFSDPEISGLPEPYHTEIIWNRQFRASLQHLQEIGFQPATILKKHPPVRALLPNWVDANISNLRDRGVNAEVVITRNPDALTTSSSKINNKLDTLSSLGLNEVDAVHTYPNILSSNEQSLARKMRLIELGAQALQWEGSVVKLIQSAPSMLTASSKKILMFLRLAADGADISQRQANISTVRSLGIVPIENFIIAMGDHLEEYEHPVDVLAHGRQLSRRYTVASERKQLAREVLDSHHDQMERIDALYSGS